MAALSLYRPCRARLPPPRWPHEEDEEPARRISPPPPTMNFGTRVFRGRGASPLLHPPWLYAKQQLGNSWNDDEDEDDVAEGRGEKLLKLQRSHEFNPEYLVPVLRHTLPLLTVCSPSPPAPSLRIVWNFTAILFLFFILSGFIFFFSFNCLARKYRHYLVFDLWNLIYNFEVGCLYKNLEDPADPDCCKSPPSPPSRKWRMFGKTSLLVGKWDFQTGSRIFLLNIQKTEYPVFQFDSS